MTRRGVIIVAASFAFLTACGQKGALYFAEEKTPEPTSKQASASSNENDGEKSTTQTEPSADSQ